MSLILGIIIGGVIIVGLAVFGITAGAFGLAMGTKKDDPNHELKLQAENALLEKQQQVKQLSSKISVMEMDAKRLDDKIAQLDSEMEACQNRAQTFVNEGNEQQARVEITKKENLRKQRDSLSEKTQEYRNSILRMRDIQNNLDAELVQLEMRKNEAMLDMSLAQTDNNANSAIADLEKRAQYEKDYNEAMQELNGISAMQGASANEYVTSGTVDSAVVDAELEKLRSSQSVSGS